MPGIIGGDMPTVTDLTVYEPKAVPKTKNIAIVYRTGIKNQVIHSKEDQWFFLTLKSAHYTCGTSYDMIMLMDGITQTEFRRDAAFIAIFPALRPDAVIMEAG
jgi:hypothetical protein